MLALVSVEAKALYHVGRFESLPFFPILTRSHWQVFPDESCIFQSVSSTEKEAVMWSKVAAIDEPMWTIQNLRGWCNANSYVTQIIFDRMAAQTKIWLDAMRSMQSVSGGVCRSLLHCVLQTARLLSLQASYEALGIKAAAGSRDDIGSADLVRLVISNCGILWCHSSLASVTPVWYPPGAVPDPMTLANAASRLSGIMRLILENVKPDVVTVSGFERWSYLLQYL